MSKFLKEKHGDKYWLINTSERATYDKETYFNNQASEYHWPDHHGPPFHYCFQIAKECYRFLQGDPENVIIVHCNSGKGRTGTGICAFLLFCGFFDNVDDCVRFYGHRRFTTGKGVSQPCQLRYLYYFESFYMGKIKSPAVKRLVKVEMHGVPKMQGDGCMPHFKIYLCHGKPIDPLLVFTYPPHYYYGKKDNVISLELTEPQKTKFALVGDVKITMDH